LEGIFISYRRDDAAGYAGRLYDRLAAHFGAEAVFMDVEGIEPGTDFVNAIEGAVASCKVLIVLIGREWLTATDASGRRRLDDPHDFVRLETGAALKRDIRVVPVLVDNAVMPEHQDLPEELQLLVRRQAVELHHKQWDATSGDLIKTLERILKVPDATRERPSSQSGNKLWITAAALVLSLAGITYWQFSPVDQKEPSPEPTTPLTDKKETSEPVTVLVKPPTNPIPKESEGPAKNVVDKTPTGQKEEKKSAEPTTEPTISEVEKKSAEPTIEARVSEVEKKSNEATVEAPVSEVEKKSIEPTTETTVLETQKIPDKPAVVVTKPTAPVVTEPKQPVAEVKPKPAPVKPEVKPEPPVIKGLTTRNEKTSVSLCYLVEGANRLRLTPIPGELKIPTKECVNVDVDKPTSFTLTAFGPGGSSSKKITVSPHPDKTAKLTSQSHLPRTGEYWVYQTRGKWPTSPHWTFRISVQQADDKRVSETLAVLKPVTRDIGIRNSNGGDPGFLFWPDIGLEFSPWLDTYVKLSGKESWDDFSVPDTGSWTGWSSNGEINKFDNVNVPAGTFEAWEVEVWSSRAATGGPTLSAQEPVRIQHLVWYAPKIKRYVKSIRKVISANGQTQEEDLFELTEYKQN